MVAVSSRLAVLVAFAWLAGVTGAPVQDNTSNNLSHRSTHSDSAHKHSKPPVIPAPKGHKVAKGHNHKQLKVAHKRSAANIFASNPFAKMAAFAMNGPARRQGGGGILKRQQAILSASVARSQLGRRDHDHDHDHDDDDDHHHHHHHHHHHDRRNTLQVTAFGSEVRIVTPRDESSKGAVGVVAIESPSTDSGNKHIAYMFAKQLDGALIIDASEQNKTEIKLVPVSDVAQNQSAKVVQMQIPVYNKDYMMTQDYCVTFDKFPPAEGSELTMRPCGEENQTKSQMFSYDAETAVIRPASAGDTSSTAQVGDEDESLVRREESLSSDGVEMKFIPKDVEMKEPPSTTAYASTVTATETFTSTATVTVSTSPTSMSAAETASSSLTTESPSSTTTSTTVAPVTSSTMPAALDIKLVTPSSISPSVSSSEPTASETSAPTPTDSVEHATSTSVDAAAVASSIAVGDGSSS